MNGGACIMLLVLNSPNWFTQPTALVWQWHGALSVFLALCGVGVGVSSLRDGFAALALSRRGVLEAASQLPDFGAAKRSFLVTGATGFIFQKLVRALLRDGQRVTVLTRQARQAAWLFEGQVDCIGSMDQLPTSRRVDVIVNLAGARVLGWRWTEARRAALRKSRVELTASVVAWIARAEHKSGLLLSASAIGYYGNQARGDDSVLTENAPPQPIFMSDLCREWEQAAGQASAHGVRVALMRIGVVLGMQGALPMMLMPIKIGLGGPLGGGAQWQSWIHVDDVINAIAHLCRSGGEGAYNFTAPESIRQAEFSQVAARVLGRPYGIRTPGFPMRLALGEQADLLLEGSRVAPARLSAAGFTFSHPRLEGRCAALPAKETSCNTSYRAHMPLGALIRSNAVVGCDKTKRPPPCS